VKFPDLFAPEQAQLLAEIKARDLSERQAGSTDPLRLKALTPAVAQYLYMQLLRGPAHRIAEFGTSAGYSTIHLAHAAQRSGGRVYTLDREKQKTAWARENIRACSLEHQVEFFTGEIEDFIAQLPDDLDFVLFDFGVPHFAPHWPAIREKMALQASLFVDGAERIERWHSDPEMRAFKEQLERDPDFVCTLLALEKGNLIAVRVS